MTTTDVGERARIRVLNDRLRTECLGGAIVCTNGVAALPEETRRAVMAAVQAFDAFNEANDPYGEHDCAVIEAAGQRIIFKVDYFDLDMRMGSPDPSNPAVTTRVLTLMLAEEY